MTTYYVRKGFSDGNAGTTPATAWATIDKAANTVAAGDTVYIGAGVYPETVTMDTPGSSGSPITYISDITGEFTGDPGLVIITGFDDGDAVASRAIVWDTNGKSFIVCKYIMFYGASGTFVVGNITNASHIAYEGCEFIFCQFCTGGRENVQEAFKIEINNGVTPTANGLTFSNCFFHGSFDADWDSNASAHVNLKWFFNNCIFVVGADTSLPDAIELNRVTNGGAFTIGGITVNGCTFIGFYNGIGSTNFANTTNPSKIYNCLFIGANTVWNLTSATAGTWLAQGNKGFATGGTGGTFTESPPDIHDNSVLIGGIHDWLLRVVFGWSPYQFWEPMTLTGLTNNAVSRGQNSLVVGTVDAYNNPRQLGYSNKLSNLFYFDGSDAAVSDPNSVWTSEANITDTNETNTGSTGTTGSAASNFVKAEGTNAPGSGGTILNVYIRAYARMSAGSSQGNVEVYTDALAEDLGSLTITTTTLGWSSWSSALTVPSGGWTWAKIQDLEFKAWRVSGAGSFVLGMIEIGVEEAVSALDAGAVESRNRIGKESTTFHAGSFAGNFLGAGFHDEWLPVNAEATTVSVYARFDSNYNTTVGKPKLLVLNIPGVADQSDTMTSGANTWEQLSCTFTPSAAGWVRVRYVSQDCSTNGKAFFDDKAVTV